MAGRGSGTLIGQWGTTIAVAAYHLLTIGCYADIMIVESDNGLA